jgi:4a-hydroxytetrahydrobiopterin dehydratase
MVVLSETERGAALTTLCGWRYDPERNGISRAFRFADFNAAFGFMARVALEAEKADHHPDWSNVWNQVDILLSTHSAGGVTEKDLALARAIDRIAGALAEPATAH